MTVESGGLMEFWCFFILSVEGVECVRVVSGGVSGTSTRVWPVDLEGVILAGLSKFAKTFGCVWS